MSALEAAHLKKNSDIVFMLFWSHLSALCPHYPD